MATQKPLVLVVEDIQENELLISLAVKKARGEAVVRSVRSGEAAIQYLSGEPPFEDREKNPLPSLIILDLGLPGISGLDVLDWIRDQENLRGAPVFVLTAADKLENVRRAFDAGAVAYQTKPVNPLEISSIVGDLLDDHGDWRQAAS